jgi:hypothetical protein
MGATTHHVFAFETTSRTWLNISPTGVREPCLCVRASCHNQPKSKVKSISYLVTTPHTPILFQEDGMLMDKEARLRNHGESRKRLVL